MAFLFFFYHCVSNTTVKKSFTCLHWVFHLSPSYVSSWGESTYVFTIKHKLSYFFHPSPSLWFHLYDHCSPAILSLKIRHLCWECAWKEFYPPCNTQSTITAVEITSVLISAVFVSLTIQSGLKGDRKSRLSFSLIGCPAVFRCRDPWLNLLLEWIASK